MDYLETTIATSIEKEWPLKQQKWEARKAAILEKKRDNTHTALKYS